MSEDSAASLDSNLLSLVATGSQWSSQGGVPDQMIALVDTEISRMLDHTREEAQHYEDARLLDVLEHLVWQRNKAQGGHAFFDMTVGRLLDHIDDHTAGAPCGDLQSQLARLVDCRGHLMQQGAPLDRIDRTISHVMTRMSLSEDPQWPVDPFDSASQMDFPDFDMETPLDGTLEFPKPEFHTGPSYDLGSSLVSKNTIRSSTLSRATESSLWMRTDDFSPLILRVAFLNGRKSFSLHADQVRFDYLPDRGLLLFNRRQEGHLPRVIREFSCSPDEIVMILIHHDGNVFAVDVVGFEYRILIHSIPTETEKWINRVQRLNPRIPIERTR